MIESDRITSIEMTLEDGSVLRNSEDDGVTLEFENGEAIRLSFADLADRERTRAAFYEQLGHELGDDYDDERHAQVVQVLLHLSGYRRQEEQDR